MKNNSSPEHLIASALHARTHFNVVYASINGSARPIGLQIVCQPFKQVFWQDELPHKAAF